MKAVYSHFFERYNIVSEGDLIAAAKRLDLVMGTTMGTNAPFPGSLPTETPADLLESHLKFTAAP